MIPIRDIRPNAVPTSILVVDADLAVASDACRMLSEAGFRGVSAASCAAAEASMAQLATRLRAVLVDVTLSGSDALVTELRRLRPGLPIVVTGPFSSAQLQRRFARGLVSGYLPKPFTAATLSTCLRAVAS